MISHLDGEYSSTAISECHMSSYVIGKVKSAKWLIGPALIPISVE